MMRTEVRRPRCPVERWYWIADQVSLLNVIACVRLTGHVLAGAGRAAADLAAEHPPLRVAIRANADGANPVVVPSLQGIPVRTVCGGETGAQFISGISISGYLVATVNTSHAELFWNFAYIADVAVSQRSARRFADGCLRTLLASNRLTRREIRWRFSRGGFPGTPAGSLRWW